MRREIREHIDTMSRINSLIDSQEREESDILSILYYELLEIIFYRNFDDLVTYSKKVYDLNVSVEAGDSLGFNIKSFILLYLNDAIHEHLIITK